ncbi:PspC domain-containing protein [Streptomyces sulphureus]|uniref:PspC domain-containing protein n=1 Tax=Streptomyces sulphureus TaxID=47758 RepID=UPI00037634B2|nr:PspC domain-containing protein [Streptomyces sulphureus]
MTEEQQPAHDGGPSEGPGPRAPRTGTQPGPWVDDWRRTIGGEAPPGGQQRERLRRGRKHKVVGGVCAGLGRYFDVDPIVFRAPLAVVSVVGGLGLVFYGFAWLVIPAEGETQNEARRLLSGRVEASSLSAILVALVGCGLFLAALGSRGTLSSLVLIGVVVGAALWSRNRREEQEAGAQRPADPALAQAVAEAPPETAPPPTPSTPSWWREGTSTESGTGYLWGPDDGQTTEPPAAAHPRQKPASSRSVDRRPRSIGALVQLLAVCAAVAGALAEWGERPLGTALAVGLGCALAVLGTGLAVSSFLGRVGGGTIAALLLTAALLAGAAVIPKEITTEWTEASWRPQAASHVRGEYRVGTGQAQLDLGELSLRKSEKVATRVRMGAGEIRVRVPENATVRAELGVELGDLRWPESTDEAGEVVYGNSGGVNQQRRLTLHPFDGAAARGTVRLDLSARFGHVEVVRDTTDAASDSEATESRVVGTVRALPAGRPEGAGEERAEVRG